ncbi:acyl carrier protein [Helicobacter bizzozeronii]|uniref:acyl carrier protein n=1 Tax=Helicobacter bizzozeronii TaxID=56877 RepID=UPI000CED8247|nr:acyl carrier protein [Helicobacter bizzozeronii]
MKKYKSCFMEALNIGENEVEGLEYQGVPSWDSVGHMALMAALEEAFNIELETDDIVDFSSFERGIEILSKYGVTLE